MSESESGRGLERWIGRIVGAVVIVYFVGFTLFWNDHAPTVQLVPWPTMEPRELHAVVVVALSFVAGVVVMAIFASASAIRRAAQARRQRRRIAALEEELARLRNLPLEEDLHAPPEAGTADGSAHLG